MRQNYAIIFKVGKIMLVNNKFIKNCCLYHPQTEFVPSM